MKRFLSALTVCLFISLPVMAAETAAPVATPAAETPKADSCAFDAKKLVLTDIVKLYSCVPIADSLCTQSCGANAISTDINTTIQNKQIGKTTIVCKAPATDAKTDRHEVTIEGLTDTVFVQCVPNSNAK